MRSPGPIGETVRLFAFVAELVIVNIGLVGCAQRNVGNPNSRANIHHLRTPWTWGVLDGGIQQRHFSVGVIHLQMGFPFRDRPVDPYCILRYRRATVLWTSRYDSLYSVLLLQACFVRLLHALYSRRRNFHKCPSHQLRSITS